MEDNYIETNSKLKFFAVYEKYMFFMGVFGQLIYYVQGVRIFLAKSAQDVSMVGFLIGLIAAISWLAYGIMLKNKALIASNVCAVIGAIFAIVAIFVHS